MQNNLIARTRTLSFNDPFLKLQRQEEIVDLTEFNKMALELLGQVKVRTGLLQKGQLIISQKLNVLIGKEIVKTQCSLYPNQLIIQSLHIQLSDHSIQRKQLARNNNKCYAIVISNGAVLVYSSRDLQKLWYCEMKRYCKLKNFLAKYRLQEQLFNDYYTVIRKKNRQLGSAMIISKKQPYLENTIVMLHQLRHQNVMSIKGVYDDSSNYIMLVDYFEGEPLFNFLIDNVKLMEIQIATLIYQLLNLLKYLHSNKYHHGNLHPNNILINKDSNTLEIMVIGFIYRNQQQSQAEYLKFISPQFIHPEFATQQITGQQSDLYQVGVLLYMITFFGKISSEMKKKMDERAIQQMIIREFKVDFKQLEQFEQRLIDFQPIDHQYRHVYSISQLELIHNLLGGCTLTEALNHRWFVNAKQKSKIKKQNIKLPSLKTILEIREISDLEGSRSHMRQLSCVKPSIEDSESLEYCEDSIDEMPMAEYYMANIVEYNKTPSREHHLAIFQLQAPKQQQSNQTVQTIY